MADKKIKVCLVEDYELTRSTFKYSLSNFKDLNIVGDFETAEECISFLNTNNVDVILMDLGLPHLNGLEAIQIIKEKYPEIKIIVITSHETDEEVMTALSIGANAYSLKDIEFSELHNIINTVYKGAIWLDSRIVKIAIKAFQLQKEEQVEKESFCNLTKREKQVLSLLSVGLSNTQIAEKLIISAHTAKVHVSNILSKLGVTDRVQAAVKAYKHNLCPKSFL